MRKMTMPNFCINFLNKAAKSLPILYDFAVASLADAWIKIGCYLLEQSASLSHPLWMRGLKYHHIVIHRLLPEGRIPRGCVD